MLLLRTPCCQSFVPESIEVSHWIEKSMFLILPTDENEPQSVELRFSNPISFIGSYRNIHHYHDSTSESDSCKNQ